MWVLGRSTSPPGSRWLPLTHTSLPPLFTRTFLTYLSIFAVTKKYLKNQKIKEYVRVVSCKGGYEMKYFNIQADGDEVRTCFGL